MAQKKRVPRSQRSFERQPASRNIKKRLLIICEGTTEARYFQGLRQHLKLNLVSIEIVQSQGSAPKNVVAEAKKRAQAITPPMRSLTMFIVLWIGMNIRLSRMRYNKLKI